MSCFNFRPNWRLCLWRNKRKFKTKIVSRNCALNLKSIQLLTVTLLLTNTINAQSWGNKKIKGNENATTEIRNTKDYDGIKCAGSMDYILVSRKEGKITIEGDSNLL